MKKTAMVAFAGVFTLGLLSVPAAYAEDSGSTPSGDVPSNAGSSSSQKSDNGNQQNGGESNDKDTQQTNRSPTGLPAAS